MPFSHDRSENCADHIDGYGEEHDPFGWEEFGNSCSGNLGDKVAPEIATEDGSLKWLAPSKWSVLRKKIKNNARLWNESLLNFLNKIICLRYINCKSTEWIWLSSQRRTNERTMIAYKLEKNCSREIKMKRFSWFLYLECVVWVISLARFFPGRCATRCSIESFMWSLW